MKKTVYLYAKEDDLTLSYAYSLLDYRDGKEGAVSSPRR